MEKIEVNNNWFIVDFLEKAEVVGKDKTDPNRRCKTVWKNTILIKASSVEEAYEKVMKMQKSNSNHRYKAVSGETLQWSFLGITGITSIYEDIEDGNELFWEDLGAISCKRAKKLIFSKDEIVSKLKF
jgi:ribosome-binding ATPase YchF (GTP1/OBG family)